MSLKIGNFHKPSAGLGLTNVSLKTEVASLFFLKNIQMTLGLLDCLGPVSMKQNTSRNVKLQLHSFQLITILGFIQ